jgi:DNA recombination protein RmuC
MDTTLLLILLLGLFLGAIVAWLLKPAVQQGISAEAQQADLQKNYVRREVHEQLQVQSDVLRDDILDKEQEIRALGKENADKEASLRYLNERLENQKQEMTLLQDRFKIEFENIANRLLEEKSQKFTAQNQEQLGDLLSPLREKIKDFEANIEKKYLDETIERTTLKEELRQLHSLNQQLSQDAANLVSALKGDNKMQGDWGEYQLETLLEKAGLNKNIHYFTQMSLFDDETRRQKRPDFVIQLPENKHLIIDSKLSLTAYERYHNEPEATLKRQHLKAHLDSIRSHIKDLSSKNYQQLYQIHAPDYLILFVPIEPALFLAAQEDQNLLMDAWDKNIVLVSNSTLLATMRTISYLWRQEKQKTNVLEIARQSGLLYDKFVGFVEDLRLIGLRLDSARDAYDEALNKLSDSKRYGDTLIGKAERIRELGAKTSRQLPKELIGSNEEE